MVDFKFLIETGIGVLILAIIALIGSHWSTIVDMASGEWARSLEKARAQKAAREQLYGYAVNSYADNMSSDTDYDAPSMASSLETRNETDRQTARIKAEELLTLCKVMRSAGVNREDAAAAFKASGLPFNNNVWAKAQPTSNGASYVTPIVGRVTNAKFESDPDFPYVAPST